jgi:hypothetical protein
MSFVLLVFAVFLHRHGHTAKDAKDTRTKEHIGTFCSITVICKYQYFLFAPVPLDKQVTISHFRSLWFHSADSTNSDYYPDHHQDQHSVRRVAQEVFTFPSTNTKMTPPHRTSEASPSHFIQLNLTQPLSMSSDHSKTTFQAHKGPCIHPAWRTTSLESMTKRLPPSSLSHMSKNLFKIRQW